MSRPEQARGKLVAMTATARTTTALAPADVGVAMNTGTQAAKEAGNMVDLGLGPDEAARGRRVGKQLLMTRGSLTTFSIAKRRCKVLRESCPRRCSCRSIQTSRRSTS